MFIIVTALDNSKIKSSQERAKLGETVHLYCRSKGDTRWYHKTTSTYPISRNNDLVLEKVKGKDSGKYYCYGLHADNSKHFLAQTTLKVHRK